MLPDSTRAAAQARRRRWWASSVRHHLRGEPRAGAVPAPPRAPSGRIQATAPGSRSRRARPGSSSSWPACSCLSDRQLVAAALEDARALLLTARNSSAPSLPAEGRTLHARLRPTPTRRGLRTIAPSGGQQLMEDACVPPLLAMATNAKVIRLQLQYAPHMVTWRTKKMTDE